ncbi:MAG: hypothetical protein IJU68_03835 [Bacteroidales bacterium]|nr:hypothetical protein [Bacteroidales bacterium]
MKNKLIIILALFCCSCAKPKYTDEPFFRLEYTLGGDRIVDEDYGRAERGVFGSYYESRMGGQCFCFKPVNDTVRLAGFDVTLEVKGNSAGDGFSFSVTSPEAFFICGKTYCYKNEAGSLENNPVALYHNGKRYYFIKGDFSFARLWETSQVDRFLMTFNFDCFYPSDQEEVTSDTLRIRDGFLTVCRRYKETPGTLEKMILYEK